MTPTASKTTSPRARKAAPKAAADGKLAEMLALLNSADGLELKLTVPDSQRRSALTALDIDPLDAQIRQVFFFDTPDLALNQAGVVVRARRVQNKGDDTVVKLRPVVPTDLPPSLRTSENFSVEIDAMPGGYVCSASLKQTLEQPHIREAIRGSKPIRKLFSKEQRAFFTEHTAGVDLDGLTVLGPITVFKLKFKPAGFSRKMVGELWNYPDGSRILELSTKCEPAEASQAIDETRSFLTARGIELTGEQQTKTRTALEFFSNELRAG